MQITCVAVDDEPVALEIIKAHAAQVPFLSLKQTFLNPVKALAYLEETAVDLVFLDVNMPDLSGLELAAMIRGRRKLIFTTAYADYAVHGFELAVVDYLLKPITFTRFLQACTRVQEQLTQAAKWDEAQSLLVKDGWDWIKVSLGNLLYVEASDNYVIFQETERKTITRMTLTEAGVRLPCDVFIRVHKSFIVNFTKIHKVEKRRIIIGSKTIPLSSSYQKRVFDKLKTL